MVYCTSEIQNKGSKHFQALLCVLYYSDPYLFVIVTIILCALMVFNIVLSEIAF